MIEGIKEWANSILCIGIFTAIIELALPKGNIKKYIYVIIGIVTIMTIISPIISNQNYEKISNEAIEVVSKQVNQINQNKVENNINTEDYLNYQRDLVKNEYMANLEKTIWNDLVSKGVILTSVDIEIDSQYNVNLLKIIVKKYGEKEYTNKNDIWKYIESYYDISSKCVEIIEEEK